MDVGLKHHLGAIDLGTVLGANNHDAKLGANNPGAKLGVKVPAKSPPRLRRAQDLGAKIYDVEMCKLGATNDGAKLRVQILKSYLQENICDYFSKKKDQKIKNSVEQDDVHGDEGGHEIKMIKL